MYCVDNGHQPCGADRPLHLLKEMCNLTDDEVLEQLEFNLLWHHALRLDIEETHLPQKDPPQLPSSPDHGGRLAFQETTEIKALGIAPESTADSPSS